MAKNDLEKSAFKIVWDGLNAYESGDYEAAIEYFQKAIAIEPDAAYGYHYLGRAYIKQKKYEKAIDNFEDAIKIKPDYAEAWLQMGLAYLGLGKEPKAAECIKRGNQFASTKEKKPIR